MTSSIAGGFASLPDPYWSVEDYVRFADHPSAEVRLWGLEHLDELGLEIPVETLRRRLQDVDLSVATKAAALVGQLEVTSLADVLHARLERAEDAVGAACAGSLALLGDPRVVKLIRQRSHLPVESRDPRIWVALSDLKGPEAQGLLLAAFDGLSSQASATTASLLSSTLMLADPERGIPRVVGRWAGQGDNAQTDALLHGLLLLCAFLEGTEEFRNAMDPDQEPSEVSLPKDILDGLADLLPLGPIRDIRKSCHRRKWSRALAALVPVAEPLASRAPIEGDVALARLLVPALAEHAETIYRTKEKSRDAVGLLLLAFDQLAQAARETNLVLPEGLDAQLGWLLSDAAFPYPQGVAAVSSRLIAAGPAEAWERMCIQTIERRAAQAATAASLLGAWESKRAIPVLLGALAADDDIELPTAAAKALVNIGEPAMGAIVQTLASSEDHAVLGECLDACIRLPSRRAVDAICLRFGELFAHAPEALLEAVRWIGAREFVEPLRAEVREGERQAEDTFAFLCDLHGAADDRLPGIRERQMSEISRRAGGEQDLPDFSEDHIDLALQCNGCHRTYTYPVKAVYIDPDPHEEDRIQPFIKDRIRCKGCGRENDYTLAPAAYLALTGRLLLLLARIEKEGPEVGGEGPLFLMKMGLTDGRRMNPREARLDYEARLTKLPDDPQLLIGYANLLRFLGETDRAETELRRALVLEPRAAEAYATLGQLAEARGDLEAAKELYRQCLDQGWRARFFHVVDRRALIQNVEEALGGIEGAMAMRPAEPVPATARLDALIAQDQARLKVGRNDPCPCGSGKKYKKCCLLKQSAEPVASGPSGPEIRLQERVDDYLERSLPKSEVRRAMQVYFGEPLDRDGRRLEPDPEALDAEWPAFRDWLLYDFRLSDGQTPIARFLSERGHRLPADERAILVEWLSCCT